MTDFLLLKHDVPLRFVKSSEAPASPENGMIYYDTSANLFKVYENGQWQALSSRDYAKNAVASFDVKESCEVASTGNISATYANGTSGVGATLTGAGALGTIDGVTLSVGQRVLLLGQTAAEENGVYTVTDLNPFVLTRAVDFDDSEEVNGGEFVFVKNGTIYANCAFVCTNSGANPIIGTTALTFVQFSGAAKTLQQFYAIGNEISTSSGQDVIIGGSEKVEVTATGGMQVTSSLSAGQTVMSSTSVDNAVDVASTKFVISSGGNITKLNNLETSFPTSASQYNYALANNGSGTLSFTNISLSNQNDVILTSLSNGSFLNYNSTSAKWENSAALQTATVPSGPVTTSTVNTYIDGPTPGLDWSSLDGNPANGTRKGQTISGISGYLAQASIPLWRFSGTQTETLHVFVYEWLGTSLTPQPTAQNAIGKSSGIVLKDITNATYNFTFSNPIYLDSAKEYLLLFSDEAFTADLYFYSARASNSSSYPGKETYYIPSSSAWFQAATGRDLRFVLSIESGPRIITQTGIVQTNGSGFLDSSFFQYKVNIGNNLISGIAAPSVSTDLANQAYVDAVTLQKLYDQDVNGSGASITTGSVDGNVIIAGTEKLQVTASGGVDLSQILSISGSMVAGNMVAGNGSMSVSALGDVGRIRGVSYSFPASQATGSNYALVNDGSGNLTWGQLKFSEMSDALVSTASNQEIIQWNGSNWVNVSAVTSGSSSRMFMTDISGRLDTVVLQHDVDFGVNVLSSILAPVASTDAVPKYVADVKAADSSSGTGSVTLQLAYGQDIDGSDVLITTTSVDGSLEVAGSEALKISSSKGFLLADSSDDTKFVKTIYKHSLSLSASQTNTALSDLTFDPSVYQGCLIEYRIKDDESGASRLGTLLVSSNGTYTAASDSFAETSDLGVSWSVALNSGNVEIRYTTDSTAKKMSAQIKYFA